MTRGALHGGIPQFGYALSPSLVVALDGNNAPNGIDAMSCSACRAACLGICLPRYPPEQARS